MGKEIIGKTWPKSAPKITGISVDTFPWMIQQRYISLDQAYERVKGENKEQKTVADDYEVLCRGYGREKIAARVQAIREQENAERMQRRSRRRHEIEVR